MADLGKRKRKIFVSATSRDLRSFRQAIVQTLEDKGFEVVIQERFDLDYREVVRMLRHEISPCDAVLCLVGFVYGAEPDNRPADAPRRSYTQLEYDLGTLLKKPVFVFLASDACALDSHEAESDELRQLQLDYRQELHQRRQTKHASTQLYYDFSSRDELVELIGDRFPTADEVASWSSKTHNLPYGSLGTLFKGREEFLATLRERLLARPGAAALIVARQAIHGNGGVGKTRLAIEYAWRYLSDYTAVLFVSANTPSDLHRNLAALAGPLVLNLPEQAVTEEEVQVAAVLRWLRENPGWLLILDNVDTKESAVAVEALLPRLELGHLLVTSRRRQWGAGLEPLPLDVLDETAATDFLLERTHGQRKPTPDDQQLAAELAHELDGLALALEQAAAYIARHRSSLREYLARWREQDARLRDWFDEQVMKYPRSLAATWETTVEQLDHPARALLRILACLAPDPIPEDLLRTEEAALILADGAASLGGERSEGLADVLAALADLAAYSLIKWEVDGVARSEHGGDGRDVGGVAGTHALRVQAQGVPPGSAFTMHRLVQEVTRGRTPADERRDWLDRALRLINAYAPPEPQDVRTWPVWEPLIAHLTELLARADKAGITAPTTRLMNELGVLLYSKCLFDEAERLYRRALAIDEQSYGSEHPEVATDLNNLAQLLKATNRLSEAEPLMRRALAIDEQSYGPDHPEVATALNNLAALLWATNRLGEAEPLMRRALAIDEQSYGPEHPDVATDLNNLAQLLKATNRLGEAEPLMRRALAIDEQSYGSEHPEVATDLNNLAQLLKATNRLGEAEPLMRRALAIDEQSYGPEHPEVATDLNNLAQLLQATNRLGEAEPLMRRALAIDEQSYGPDHPRVATDLNNLAQLLQDTNRLGEAEPLMRRALAIDEQSYGPDHPNVAIRLNNLAQLLKARNRLAVAELLMRRAVVILRQFGESTGYEHPYMRSAIENYRQLLAAMQLGQAEIEAKLREVLGGET